MLPYLSLAIWVPIVAGLLVLAVNRDADAAAARWLGPRLSARAPPVHPLCAARRARWGRVVCVTG